MEPYKSKVVPPDERLSGHLRETIERRLRDRITAAVLAEARIDVKVSDAMAGLAVEIGKAEAALPRSVPSALESDSHQHWTQPVDSMALAVAAKHCEKPKRGRKPRC
jgi:hypothetical protein